VDIINRTKEVISGAERALAALAAEALSAKEYRAAATLVDLVQEMNGLLEKSRELLEAPENGAEPGPPRDLPLNAKGHLSARAKKKLYPRFVREGDNLVKIGWSKAEKSEYEHKSPKRVLSVLLPALGSVGGNGKRFTMDRLLPLVDKNDGAELPDYQAYLCLAWVRTVGLVKQHGRQGYSLGKNGNLVQAAEALWQQLPSR